MLKGQNFKFLIILLLLTCSVFSNELEVYFFKAGQGNVVLLKNRSSKKSLLIDCGFGDRIFKSDGIAKIKTKTIISEVINIIDKDKCPVILTHQHDDHYNGITQLIGEIGGKLPLLIVGGNKNLRTELKKNLPEIIQDTQNFADSFDFFQVDKSCLNEISNRLSNILGQEITIQCLLPGQSVGSSSEHEQNLVIKITYAGRSILFPGDASGKLIDQIAKDNDGCFSDIDVWVMPHHGSNTENAWRLYTYLYNNPKNVKFPCLTLISSDPDSNKREHLPNSITTSLKFLPPTEALIKNHLNYFCIPHSCKAYSADTSVDHFVGKTSLFETCNADNNYYKITITPQGTITLQDGEQRPAQFISFLDNKFTSEEFNKNFIREINRIFSVNKLWSSGNLVTRLKLLHCLNNFDEDYLEFLYNKDLLMRDHQYNSKNLVELMYNCVTNKINNYQLLQWGISKFNDVTQQLQLENKAKKLLFLENFPDQTDWNMFILQNNLIGENHQEIATFLMQSLYNSAEGYLRDALVEGLKHYSPDNGYQTEEGHYSNSNYIREILNNPNDFDEFKKFLLKVGIFKDQ